MLNQSIQPQLNRGFTLLEVLLVLAILALVAGVGIPLFFSYQNNNALDTAQDSLAQSLRQAQMFSQSAKGDATWGVKNTTTTITLFQGTSYATRDTGHDLDITFARNITPSGLTEVVFAKRTGLPNATGTFVFATDNASSTVDINTFGVLHYE